jgi:hypothetical protein
MSTPFTIAGSLNYPGDASLPADPIPLALSSASDHEASSVLKLTGSGTKAVGMGTIPAAGAKGILIKVDPGAGVAPILVTINAGSVPVEISAGGLFLLGNPSPAAGITALSIAYTTSCVVRVWALG